MPSVRAIIHLDNFRHNIRVLQGLAAGRKICLAVKADAYGHGAVRIVREAEACGIRHFGVSRISEAAELRSAGCRSEIIMFSPVAREELASLWDYGVQAFLPQRDYFRELVRLRRELLGRADRAEDGSWKGAGRYGGYEGNAGNAGSGQAAAGALAAPLGLHIKVDTGMGRIGCAPEEVLGFAEEIAREEGFVLEGLASHFPLSDDALSENAESARAARNFCGAQVAQFRAVLKQLAERGIRPPSVHVSNTAGFLAGLENAGSMLRPGIAAYGYNPAGSAYTSTNTNKNNSRDLDLRPVMELRAEVSQVKRVAKGRGISYGHSWKASEDCSIATLNIGYADGYARALSNKASVLIRGRLYEQVGTICMDQCMVNLGKAQNEVSAFDEAIIFGPAVQGDTGSNTGSNKDGALAGNSAPETAASLAEKAGTIPYEITCGISARVPREYSA